MDDKAGPSKEKEDYNLILVSESAFTTVFPKYREKYMKEAFPLLSNFLSSSHGIKCELDLLEGSITVSTTKAMKDPYAIIKARDSTKLISRGVPFSTAIRVLEEDETSSDIIKIGRLIGNKERFVKRRQRLLGSSGSTLKAIELLTNCYVLIQGNTVSAVGPFKGLQNVRKIVTDCIQHNIHPVYNIKRLMIQKELMNNPQLKNENWERFLPKLPPKSKEIKDKLKAKAKLSKSKVKKGKNKKKDYTPFPPPPAMSKIDLQLESGEYFMNEKKKKDEKKFNRRTEKDVQAFGEKKQFFNKRGSEGNKRSSEGNKRSSEGNKRSSEGNRDTRTGFKPNQRGGGRGGKSSRGRR